MKKQRIYFYHGKLPNGGRYTVAGMISKEGILTLGYSLCSNKDQFCKKTGRIKAQGKMLSKPDTGGMNTIVLKDGWEGKEVNNFLGHARYAEDQNLTHKRAMMHFHL